MFDQILILLQYIFALVIASVPLFFFTRAIEAQKHWLAFLGVILTFVIGYAFLQVIPFGTKEISAMVDNHSLVVFICFLVSTIGLLATWLSLRTDTNGFLQLMAVLSIIVLGVFTLATAF